MFKKFILMFFLLINSLFSTTYTVGVGGNFATISAAITAAKNGDTLILLANNTFSIASTINVNKALTIQGQDKATCIVDAAVGLSTTINITSSYVTLENFTLNNTNTGSTAADITSSSCNLVFDNLILNTGETGISLVACHFTITNCIFNQTQLDSQRFIILNGNIGNSIISNNTWNEPIGELSGRFVYLTGANPYFGSLTISNNSQGTGPFSQFFIMDNLTGGNFNLIIDNNIYSPTNGGIIFFATVNNALDMFSLIKVTNNTDTGNHGKGIITIDGAGGPFDVATNPSLLFEMYGNSVLSITAANFAAATGLGQIAYNNLVFNPFHVALPPYNLSISQHEEIFPLQSDILQGISWQNADSENIIGFRIYQGTTSNLIKQTNSTFFENHDLIPGVLMDYLITSFDSFGDESRPMPISRKSLN